MAFNLLVFPVLPAAYMTERLSLALTVSSPAAFAHANEHGTHHTDCIVTE
jgi:gamma-glutamyl phosphate reductase